RKRRPKSADGEFQTPFSARCSSSNRNLKFLQLAGFSQQMEFIGSLRREQTQQSIAAEGVIQFPDTFCLAIVESIGFQSTSGLTCRDNQSMASERQQWFFQVLSERTTLMSH